MRIDQIDSYRDGESKQLELHGRLTVIASTDISRRREAFGRALAALNVTGGTSLYVCTEDGESIYVERSMTGTCQMVDVATGLDVDMNRRGLGFAGQLNHRDKMHQHLDLLHVSVDSARRRHTTDAEFLSIANGPIDRLWSLANIVQKDREALKVSSTRGEDVSQAARERERKERSVAESVERKEQSEHRVLSFNLGGLVLTLLAIGISLTVSSQLAMIIALAAFGLFVLGAYSNREALDAVGADAGHTAFRVQLGRLDELFDTDSISQREKLARANLDQSLKLWKELAGSSDPATLLKHRRRITELSNTIRLLRVEQQEAGNIEIPAVLIGLAAHLAELSSVFPAERVPLLVDDFFAEVPVAFHGALLEMLLRGGQRRQLILESGDMDICGWAAAEAVLGNALLITDEEVHFPSNIQGAASSH